MTELLFYGGLILAGLSLIGLVLATIIISVRKRRLLLILDKEYGEKK